MEEYVKRMILERENLTEKINKLADFILSDDFRKVERKERRKMHKQLKFMGKYREVLNDRIALHCTIEEDEQYVKSLKETENKKPLKSKKKDGSKEN